MGYRNVTLDWNGLKEALSEVNASGPQFIFNIFWWPLTCHTMKTNRIKLETINPELCSTSTFLEKSLGLISPPHSGYDFKKNVSYAIF